MFQLSEQIEDLGLNGHVKCGRRLVRNEQGWVAGQSHGDHHALLHTAAELVRVIALSAFGIG